MEGDIVVMGSDGLFDNVFDHEIISTVSGSPEVAEAGLFTIQKNSKFNLKFYFLIESILSIVAKILANLASNHSKDPNFDSPYSMEARSRVRKYFQMSFLFYDGIVYKGPSA